MSCCMYMKKSLVLKFVLEKCRKDLTTKFTDGLSTLLVVLEVSFSVNS